MGKFFVDGVFLSFSVGVHCDLLQGKKGNQAPFFPHMGCKHPSCICFPVASSAFLIEVSRRSFTECWQFFLGALQTESLPVHWTSNINRDGNSEAKTNVQNETAKTFFKASGVKKFIVQINFYHSLLAFQFPLSLYTNASFCL